MKTFVLDYEEGFDLSGYCSKNKIKDKKYQSILVQIFSGKITKTYLKKVGQAVKKELPQSIIMGATTAGEILHGEMVRNKTVISITCFEETLLNCEILTQTKDSFSLGSELAKKVVQNDTKAIIAFGTGLTVNGEEFLKGIEKVNKKVTVAGGMAGDNEKFKATYIFNEKEIISNGAMAVSLNDKNLIVHNAYNFDWQNIGKFMEVTKACQNRIYEINDRPVTEVYATYLGEEVAKKLPTVEFPLILKKHGMNVARDVLNKFEDGSLFLGGNIKIGDKVQFGYGNVDLILRSFAKIYLELQGNPIESVFVYSCTARRIFLGKSIEKEILPLNNIADTSGFFTYGEFFHVDDAH